MTETERVMVSNPLSGFNGKLGSVVRVHKGEGYETVMVLVDGWDTPLPFARREIVNAPAGNRPARNRAVQTRKVARP
jgi:hypothetical protein